MSMIKKNFSIRVHKVFSRNYWKKLIHIKILKTNRTKVYPISPPNVTDVLLCCAKTHFTHLDT